MLKKIFISLFFILTASSYIFAQQILISSDSITVYGFSSQHEVVAKANLSNEGSAPVTVVWKRIVNEFPPTWMGNGTQICDMNACWMDTINSKSFVLNPGGKSNLDVHFQNNFEYGEAMAKIVVYDLSDSAGTAQVITYRAFVDESTSVWDRNNNENESIRIYPNPARDVINIKKLPDINVRTIEIYNILGTKMVSHTLRENQNSDRIGIEDLPRGIYMVRVYDDAHRLIYTKSISRVE